jgi:hypothetical protein
MAKLLEADVFRKRYFERGGPTDQELIEAVSKGDMRGTIVCGRVYIADDALFNKEPWSPEKPSKNPLLMAVN